MVVIVGLGNHGRKYEHTRHNAGCDALNVLAQRNEIKVARRRFKALLGEGTIAGKRCVLAFPQTYMNDSGASVIELSRFYKPEAGQLIVLYDDVDLPQGAIRVRKSGGPGTHNGMRSILQHLGTEQFPRVRIGIGKPPGYMDIKDYVLGTFPKADWQTMFDAYVRAAQAVEEILHEGPDSAMARFNAFPGAAVDADKPPK